MFLLDQFNMMFAAGAGYKVNPAAQLAVRGINGASAVIAGTGVVNGVYDLYLVSSLHQIRLLFNKFLSIPENWR